MKQNSNIRPSSAVKREATDWWVRLDSDELDQGQYQLFLDWLNSDPAHALAFDEITRLWGELDAVKPLVANVSISEKQRKTHRWQDWWGTINFPRPVQWTTTVAVCCLILWLSPFGLMLRADYSTGIGEIRTIQLGDGSKVHLNSDSALAVSMDAGVRRLSLLKGEALFEVNPDPNRPFRVHAGDGTVTALGTAFNIRLGDQVTEVAVTEHSVAVKLDENDELIRLEEGQSLVYDSNQGIGNARIADTHAITAWQRGMLVFENKPLGEVVAELNRYYPGFLMISDAGIAERRVSGVFRINNPLAVVDTLQTSLQLKSTHITDYLILLHR